MRTQATRLSYKVEISMPPAFTVELLRGDRTNPGSEGGQDPLWGPLCEPSPTGVNRSLAEIGTIAHQGPKVTIAFLKATIPIFRNSGNQ